DYPAFGAVIVLSSGILRDGGIGGAGDAHQIVGREDHLAAADTGADADGVEQDGCLIEEERVWLLDTDGRDATAYVTGESENFFDGDELDLLITAGGGEGLEVELGIGRDGGHEDAGAVAAGDQGFEDLLGRHTDLFGDARGAEVVFVDLVFAELIVDAGGVKDSGSVGFDGHETNYCSNRGKMIISSGGTGSTGRPALRQGLRPPWITATWTPLWMRSSATRALVASRIQVQ